MSLSYIVTCEACSVETRYDDQKDMPYETHFHSLGLLCKDCEVVAEAAKKAVDRDLYNKIRELRGL